MTTNMGSIWEADGNLPAFQTQNRDIRTDVLIIGGGMAGLLCAYMLARAGVDYALVEKDRIGAGVTKNTTAKITSQHGLIYDQLIRRFGLDKARLYLRANEDALDAYRTLAKNIDCDFETQNAYTYTRSAPQKLERELKALQRLGFDAELAEKLPLPFPTAGGICFRNQAQFHPLKFISAIAKDLNISENTKALEWKGRTLTTNRGTITAEKIVVATHFPLFNKHGSYFIKMHQQRSYILALEGAPKLSGMYVDENGGGLSFRSANGLLLLGGAGGRTGKGCGGFDELSRAAAEFYPGAQEKHRWATQDCMTLDGVPYIGRYSKSTPNTFVAAGFNKWGMTSAMAAAMLLKDLITGRDNPYAALFDPSRTILRPQLAVNAFEAAASYLTPSKQRCPHLGCALKWNAAEQSWDCPCHGSRFDREGKLINNPATDDLT